MRGFREKPNKEKQVENKEFRVVVFGLNVPIACCLKLGKLKRKRELGPKVKG